MSSKVKVRFVGIEEVMETYRSDGMVLKIGDEELFTSEKALQVLTEHSRWFELVDLEVKTLGQLERLVEAEKSEIGKADSTMGFKFISPTNEVMTIPPGSKITIETPPAETPTKKPVTEKIDKPQSARHKCETEGCNYWTKAGEDYCKKHKKEN